MDRRTFLRGAGGFAAALTGARAFHESASRLLWTGASADVKRRGSPAVTDVDGLPIAGWLVEENAREGSRGWVISPRHPPGGIEGYLDTTSAQVGEEITLFVNTAAHAWRAEVYRMGYYGGRGGRLVHLTPEIAGRRQPAPRLTRGINMVECAWAPSRAIRVDADWLPGAYLIKLVGVGGEERHIPFTVRDDASSAAFVVQSSVTTWQAYNAWGGYSLYGGVAAKPSESFSTRSRIVSFDRPYTPSPLALDANGSGDFLGNEFPFVFFAERHGLDVTYWTDVDLHERPELVSKHRALISLGHDEYWSTTMRDAASTGLHAGVNLTFLGANACYRQIRFAPSPLGANRRVICYKNASEDPILRTNPALATGASWATDPVPRPESELIGVMYLAYGANAPLVVVDANSFVFAGTGLKNGDKVSGGRGGNVVGSEIDGFEPRLAPAGNVTILAHSPTESVSGRLASDMTYYTTPSGGGVFASGTARWVQLLWDGGSHIDNALSFGTSAAVEPITQMTLNVLRAFGAGPASRSHPSVANWRHFYELSAPIRLGIDVTGH